MTVGASNYLACKAFPDLYLRAPDISYTVYSIFLLETVQTALTGVDVSYWFASGYGDVNRLSLSFASAIDVPIMESIVSVMVQYFYAYRVWILSDKCWWLCSLICLVGLSQLFPNLPDLVSFFTVLYCQRSISND